MSSVNQRDKEKYGHPTCKPLGLVKRHLKHACTNDMVVFDPFLGSGTTEKGAYNYFKNCCKNASVMLIKSANSIICIKGYNNIYNHLMRL